MWQTARLTRQLLRDFMANLERKVAAREVAAMRARAESARTAPRATIGLPPVLAHPDELRDAATDGDSRGR